MQCIKVEDLREVSLPPQLPAGTEMGVWKRSTGFEVVLPYHPGLGLKVRLIGTLVAMIAFAFFLGQKFRDVSMSDQVLLYLMIAVPIVVYGVFMMLKFSEYRATKTRVDLTPMTMTVTRVLPTGKAVKLGEFPLKEVGEVCIDGRRGLRVKGNIADMDFGLWLGQGLGPDDLSYLSCVIGQVLSLNMQYSGSTTDDLMF